MLHRWALPGGLLAVTHGHRQAAARRHARLRAAHPGARLCDPGPHDPGPAGLGRLGRCALSVRVAQARRARRAARAGDVVALAAFNTTAQWLGAGIASLAVILDPGIVVIGGGVVDAGDILLEPTKANMERKMPFAGKHPYPNLVAATLGNDAGLVGVADLARS